MHQKQRGITAVGFIILAAIIGLFAFAGIKLTPVYMGNMRVETLLNDVKKDMDGTNPTPTQIRNAIGKRINIEMIYNLKARDFKITRTGEGYTVEANYETRVNFMGNLFLVAEFDNSVEIRR